MCRELNAPTDFPREASLEYASVSSVPSKNPSGRQTTGSDPGAQSIVPEAFKKNPKSSIAFLTREWLQRLLPSYLSHLLQSDREEAVQTVMRKWPYFLSERNKVYNNVPQLIEEALGLEAALAAVASVKEDNAGAAPPPPTRGGSTLYRADTRSPEAVAGDGGLHGWGGSMSLEHARAWVSEIWNHMKTNRKADWLQDWKVQTSSRTDAMPFVATGWESQKSGQEYMAKIPFEIKNPKVNPVVVYNGDSLKKASIIAVSGRDEVVFLTGIPNKYVTPVK